MKRFFLLSILFLCLASSSAFAQRWVGVPREKMDYSASEQRNTCWCWAACIQMSLNYYGVKIRQEQIVLRTMGKDSNGKLRDQGGTNQEITQNLNNWSLDSGGGEYIVRASFNKGAPPPAVLIRELSEQRPIVIGYAFPNTRMGHAVVITGASYTLEGSDIVINSLIVRDPDPSPDNLANQGRKEYTPASQLASLIDSYWIIRVVK